MDLKSVDDVNAMMTYREIEKINKIKKEIKRLSYAPATMTGALILYYFGFMLWNGEVVTENMLLLLAVAIGVVGHTNVKRSNLIITLWELKYGANKPEDKELTK